MSCRLILGSIPTRSYPWITRYTVLAGGSCIWGLLPKGGSGGLCLGKVPRHKNKTFLEACLQIQFSIYALKLSLCAQISYVKKL
jgi:hypothetical protein